MHDGLCGSSFYCRLLSVLFNLVVEVSRPFARSTHVSDVRRRNCPRGCAAHVHAYV